MASGHVSRIQRPNTWLPRPTLLLRQSLDNPEPFHTWLFVVTDALRTHVGSPAQSVLVCTVREHIGGERHGCLSLRAN